MSAFEMSRSIHVDALPERVLPPEVLAVPTPPVEEAHRRLLAHAADAHDLGLEDASFDAAICRLGLHFLSDLPRGLAGPVAFDAKGDLRQAPVAVLRAVRRGGSRDVLSTDGAALIAVR